MSIANRPDGLLPVRAGQVEASASPSRFRTRLAQLRKLVLLGGAACVPALTVGPLVLNKSAARPRLAHIALAHADLGLLRARPDSLRLSDSLRVADSPPADDAARSIDSLAATLTIVGPEPVWVPAVRTVHFGEGRASYYGAELAGRRTANGERFNPAKLTAAHRTLPFGSLVRVTNTHNGKSVVVRINDRGPFVRSRVIDISKAAAQEIGMVRSGTAPVIMELVEEN